MMQVLVFGACMLLIFLGWWYLVGLGSGVVWWLGFGDRFHFDGKLRMYIDLCWCVRL